MTTTLNEPTMTYTMEVHHCPVTVAFKGDRVAVEIEGRIFTNEVGGKPLYLQILRMLNKSNRIYFETPESLYLLDFLSDGSYTLRNATNPLDFGERSTDLAKLLKDLQDKEPLLHI